jgi:hypothetical protein
MLHADDLAKRGTLVCIEGKWVAARSLPFYGLGGLKIRIKDAWAVLTGKADAVKFYKQ